MAFEWDPPKAAANLSDHGVSFQEAVTVFDDPRALSSLDDLHSEQEERHTIVGRSTAFRLLAVTYTPRADTTRIISARRATARERSEYVRQ